MGQSVYHYYFIYRHRRQILSFIWLATVFVILFFNHLYDLNLLYFIWFDLMSARSIFYFSVLSSPLSSMILIVFRISFLNFIFSDSLLLEPCIFSFFFCRLCRVLNMHSRYNRLQLHGYSIVITDFNCMVILLSINASSNCKKKSH